MTADQLWRNKGKRNNKEDLEGWVMTLTPVNNKWLHNMMENIHSICHIKRFTVPVPSSHTHYAEKCILNTKVIPSFQITGTLWMFSSKLRFQELLTKIGQDLD